MKQIMFCVQRKDAPNQWVKELCFKTEFKAYLCARTKSLATLSTYRIVDDSFDDVVLIVDRGKGVDLGE